MTTATRTPAAALALDVDRDALIRALTTIERASTRKGALPITNCVLLDAEGDTLVLRATNLDHAADYHLTVAVAAPGRTAVPFGLLLGVARELPDGPVTLAVAGRHLRVAAGRHTTNIATAHADDFPDPWTPAADAEPTLYVEARAAVLADALARVAVAAASSDERPALHGVLVRVRDGALTLAAADGFRLAEVRGVPTLLLRGDGDAIVPLPAIRLTQAVLGPRGEHAAFLEVHGGRMRVGAWPASVTTRLVEAAYPDYRGIVATTEEPTWSVTFPVAPALAAIRAERLIARDAANIIRIAAEDGALRFHAVAAEVGDAVADVPAELTGEPGRFAANAIYLADVLETVGAERIRAFVTDPTRPVRFEPVDGDGWRSVVMPMAVLEAVK